MFFSIIQFLLQSKCNLFMLDVNIEHLFKHRKLPVYSKTETLLTSLTYYYIHACFQNKNTVFQVCRVGFSL